MNTIVSTGLSGMRAAENRSVLKAVQIVQAPAHEAKAFTKVATAKAAAPPVRSQAAANETPRPPATNRPGERTDPRLARREPPAAPKLPPAGQPPHPPVSERTGDRPDLKRVGTEPPAPLKPPPVNSAPQRPAADGPKDGTDSKVVRVESSSAPQQEPVLDKLEPDVPGDLADLKLAARAYAASAAVVRTGMNVEKRALDLIR